MPANTPNRGYPYPLGTDPINVAVDEQLLAEAIDLDVLATNNDVVANRNYAWSVNAATDNNTAPGTWGTAAEVIINPAPAGSWVITATVLLQAPAADTGIVRLNRDYTTDLGGWAVVSLPAGLIVPVTLTDVATTAAVGSVRFAIEAQGSAQAVTLKTASRICATFLRPPTTLLDRDRIDIQLPESGGQ